MQTTDNIKNNILECVGNTPLVRLNRVAKDVACEVVVKCEFLNPGGSVKDRPAKRMVEQAHLPQSTTLIEPSSGNMGIGLALAGAVAVLKALGATVHLTPEEAVHEDLSNHLSLAHQLVSSMEKGGVMLNQYTNPNNPASHEMTTALEILKDTAEHVDAVVAGAGTGGTITGIATYFKKVVKHPAMIIGVDPEGSILANPTENKVKPYAIEGIGYDFVPPVLQLSLVDHWETVSDAEAFDMARRLIREEGMLVGGSCGAAVAGALKAIKALPQLNQPGKRVVIILPDSIRNYLSKYISDAWLLSKGFKKPSEDSKEVALQSAFLKGPIAVISRSDIRGKHSEFPLLVKSNSGDGSKIVGVLSAQAALKARLASEEPVLEKNFIIIPNSECIHPDLVATGYPIFMHQKEESYFALDINAFVAHLL